MGFGSFIHSISRHQATIVHHKFSERLTDSLSWSPFFIDLMATLRLVVVFVSSPILRVKAMRWERTISSEISWFFFEFYNWDWPKEEKREEKYFYFTLAAQRAEALVVIRHVFDLIPWVDSLFHQLSKIEALKIDFELLIARHRRSRSKNKKIINSPALMNSIFHFIPWCRREYVNE